MTSFCQCVLTGISLSALMAAPAGSIYRSVLVDSAGRLQIELDSGSVIKPATSNGQVAFGDPAIAPNHQTVGWLVMYPYPSPPDANYVHEPIAGALALYRLGHIMHMFRTEQVFWDWQFQGGGKRVAYSTGPTHGGAAECVLRDVESGKKVARWWVLDGGEPPAWARSVRV
jgi:hypothetical protein